MPQVWFLNLGLGCRSLIERAEGAGENALQRVPRGAHKIAQHGHVWLVGADSPRVHRESEPLGKFQVHASIIQLGKTKTLRGQHAIQPRWIHGPRWTMRPPWAARHLVELLPIAFVPGRHAFSLDVLSKPLDAAGVQKVHRGSFLCLFPGRLFLARAIHIHHDSPGKAFSSLVVSNTLRGDLFRVFPSALVDSATQRICWRADSCAIHLCSKYVWRNAQIPMRCRGVLSRKFPSRRA